MPVASPYCAAYEARRLREFPGWTEDVSNLRPDVQEADGEEVEVPRTALADDDVLFVHDDYVVTDDAERDSHVVFAAVDDEWKRFCHEKLGFAVPEWEVPEISRPEGRPDTPGDAPTA